MNIRSSAPCLKYGLGIAFGLGLIGIVPLPGMAQITPDETLGNERSQINRNVQVRGGNADRIEGGATRGSNLFYSFREFNPIKGQFPAACSISVITKGIWLSIPRLLAARFLIAIFQHPSVLPVRIIQ